MAKRKSKRKVQNRTKKPIDDVTITGNPTQNEFESWIGLLNVSEPVDSLELWQKFASKGELRLKLKRKS